VGVATGSVEVVHELGLHALAVARRRGVVLHGAEDRCCHRGPAHRMVPATGARRAIIGPTRAVIKGSEERGQ
jgi:hypothetical protein